MKRLTLFACGLGAVALAQPASAATGYAGAAYERTEVEIGNFDADGDGFSFEGAVAFDGVNGLGAEVDVGHEDVEDFDQTGITGHLFANRSSSRVGGFVGLADVEDETVLSLGGEALLYFRDVTLGVAGGYANADDADADGVGLDGEARFFVRDNLRLDGRISWASIDTAGGDDDALSFGAGGELQMETTPISLFAGWRHTEFDEADVSSDTLRFGARYNWGAGTLRDRDRDGAGLAGLSSLGSTVGTN